MKKLLAALIAAVFMTALVSTVRADEVTLKGEALCTKCALHETEKCSTAIRVKEDGKDVIYYAKNNDVAKAFHKNICQAPAKVTATGTVTEKDGKKWIKLSKIDQD
jgi:hypothetical protein